MSIPERIPPLPSEYQNTWFKGDVDSIIGCRGIVLTAYNPMNTSASEDRNVHAQKELEEYLDSENLRFAKISAGSKDFSHCEESVFIYDLDLEKGKRIARSFNQLAIFRVQDDQFEIYHCHQCEVVHVGSFSARFL